MKIIQITKKIKSAPILEVGKLYEVVKNMEAGYTVKVINVNAEFFVPFACCTEKFVSR